MYKEQRKGDENLQNCNSNLIDERALALKPVFWGKNRSKIITTHGTYFSTLSPKDLLDKACLNHLSTKKGRISAATLLLSYTMKPPFIISPNEYGVFPTESSKKPECVWIFNHRFTVKEVTGGESLITFMNGVSIKVQVSKYTIIRQEQRLHTLLSIGQTLRREYISRTREKN